MRIEDPLVLSVLYQAMPKRTTSKNKGFGSSQLPTREAKRFMLAYQVWAAEAKGDETQRHQFLQSNLANLDEPLLEALPLVFTTLAANQSDTERKNIALLFVDFGNAICQFPLGHRWLNLELGITA